MRLPRLGFTGFEADDIIATVARKAEESGYQTFICSRDKDLSQLVNEHTVLFDTSSGQETTLSMVKERFGVTPSQIPDLLALVGDPVDNIPGVRGIGKRTAVRLLEQFGSLEGILDHGDSIVGKSGSSIKGCKDQILLARELASVRRDVSIAVDIDKYALNLPSVDEVRDLFLELGIEALLKRWIPSAVAVAGQGFLFGSE
jgi:DNA polymerase I